MAGHRDDGTFAENMAHHPSRRVSRQAMSGRLPHGHPSAEFGYIQYPDGYAPFMTNRVTGMIAEIDDRKRTKWGARRDAIRMYKNYQIDTPYELAEELGWNDKYMGKDS